MLNLLQQYSKISGNIDNEIFSFDKLDEQFYTLILEKQLTKARTYLIEKNYNYDILYSDLFHNFVNKLPKEKQGQAILIISNSMYQSSFAIDKEITATACLLEIIGIL
jgi:hypothetical protein